MQLQNPNEPSACHPCSCRYQSQELQILRQRQTQLEEDVRRAREESDCLVEQLAEATLEREMVEDSLDQHKETLKLNIEHLGELEQIMQEKDSFIEAQEFLLALTREDTQNLESSQREKDEIISQLRDQVKGAHARKPSRDLEDHQEKKRRLSP
ncbi:Fc.00g082350.m01.CDS01 [Cosmosporella sp. VM-42]